MKPHPTSTQNLPENDPGLPNDDGCILGTAGRDEDPNATTDWDHESDSAGNVLTPMAVAAFDEVFFIKASSDSVGRVNGTKA